MDMKIVNIHAITNSLIMLDDIFWNLTGKESFPTILMIV